MDKFNINWYYIAFFTLGLLGASALGCAMQRYRRMAFVGGEQRRGGGGNSVAQAQVNISGMIAVLYTLGFMGLAVLLYFKEIPTGNKDALLYLFGILSGIELSIISFFFGGSQSADAQHKAVAESAKKSAEAVEAIATQAAPVAAAAAAAAAASATAATTVPVAPIDASTVNGDVVVNRSDPPKP